MVEFDVYRDREQEEFLKREYSNRERQRKALVWVMIPVKRKSHKNKPKKPRRR